MFKGRGWIIASMCILPTLNSCGMASPLLNRNTTDPGAGRLASDVQAEMVAAGGVCRPEARDRILCDMSGCGGCRAKTPVRIVFDIKTDKVIRIE